MGTGVNIYHESHPDQADAFINHFVSETTIADSEIYAYIKALKRLLEYFSDSKGADHEWEYKHIEELVAETTDKSIYYSKQRELSEIYDATFLVSSVAMN